MEKTRILYNDSCPICAREIRHYDRLTADGNLSLQFEKLTEVADAWGLDPETAARQLHARQGDQLLKGYDAFIALWSEVPRYRWLARLCTLPGLRVLVKWFYDRVASPFLFALHKRRKRRADASAR